MVLAKLKNFQKEQNEEKERKWRTDKVKKIYI